MRRVLSVIPAILIFCVLIFGNSFLSESAPATLFESFFLLQPPPGGGGGVNSIKIGLLVQKSTSVEAKNGASLAIAEANYRGGFKGRNFELVIKSMEGPWGTGSKQAVDMIFNDEVIAIVGLHDGRNAHLVEQATTKANVSYISAFAGDPTLSQAFTPWFFNCLPNDNQQAELLLKEIKSKKYSRITLVTDDDYDAKSAFKSFIEKARNAGIAKPVTIVLEKTVRDINETAGTIVKGNADCLLLFTEPASAEILICKLKEMNCSLQIYGPLSLLKDSSPVYNHPEVLKNLLLLSSGEWFQKENSEFAGRYYQRFKSWPGAEAAYSYDATMIMINAAVVAEGKRENVQKALMNTDYRGATGIVRFDEKGNRITMIEKRDK
jgi:branched-chain amino acid transport system substrate-binding protein